MLVAHRNLIPLQSKGNTENQSICLVTFKSLSSTIMPEERQNKKKMATTLGVMTHSLRTTATSYKYD
jgi:hypothetical protein